jgi:adenine/guanine phosphoribosyltransferase-like PRPP-binding protein
MANEITRDLLRRQKRTWHVIPTAGNWVVKRGGTRRATRVLSNQADAIALARSIARGAEGEVIIHRKDGTMQEHEVVRNGDLERIYVYSADVPLGVSEQPLPAREPS